MPVYEYACKACGHEFEREQRITEDPIKSCPACKADQARRMISRTSFVLKGGGWYSDLYSSSGKSSADAEGASGSKEGGGDTGSDGSKASGGAGSEKKKSSDKGKGKGKSSGGSSKGAKGKAAA